MGQDVSNASSINIGDYTLEVINLLGINKCFGKASAAMSTLARRVWKMLHSRSTQTFVFIKPCVPSTQ